MSTLSEITDVMRELLLRGQFSDMEIIRQVVTSKLIGLLFALNQAISTAHSVMVSRYKRRKLDYLSRLLIFLGIHRATHQPDGGYTRDYRTRFVLPLPQRIQR
jgi:hypothetical protein